MKKTIAVTLILGIILIGFVSAGLVNYLSNMVSGTVTVEGPVFYLDETNILSGKPNSMFLKLNDNNVNGNSFNLSSSDRFYSNSLEVNNFYPMDFNIILNAKIFNLPTNGTTTEPLGSCSIGVQIYQTNENGEGIKELCSVIYIGMSDKSSYNNYDITCLGKYGTNIDFNKGDRIELLLSEQCPGEAFMDINLKGESFIQIIPK